MTIFRSSGSMMQRPMAQKLIACGLVLLLMAPLERVAAAQQPQQSKTTASSSPQSAQPSTNQDASVAQPGQDQQPATPAPAVGTAAAPYEKTTGITATRPAGAVIAPAKQRRIRSILIKVGIVAGAGAAVAAVALLSHASPSQPH
jgi:hypothetical protein